MTDNFQDLEHHEPEPGDEQPTQQPGLRSNLAEAWRTRPLFKLLVVMVVVGALIAAGTSLFSGKPQEQITQIVNPPNIVAPPGGKASPYLIEQTKLADKQREEEAVKQGGSNFPTPIGQSNEAGPGEKNDPLADLRAETSRLKVQLAQMQQQQSQQPPPPPQQPERFDDSLSQAMQQQMRTLMESWVPHGIKDVTVTTKEEVAAAAKQAQGLNGTNGNQAANSASSAPPPKPVVNAGTVSYAQLLVEANSDVPGPILAQIVSGPLSGARAIGSFQIANGYNDYLVLHFSHANLKGKDYSIDAYALDPDTTLGGMATEVDERYLTRLILPTAAAFLQGLGSAIGQSNETTTVTNGLAITSQPSIGFNQGAAAGLGQAANIASQFFQNQANQTRPLVRVAAGTPMGLFFVNSVFDPNNQPQLPGTEMAGTGPYGARPQGFPFNGYPTGAYGVNSSMGGYPGATSVGYAGNSYGNSYGGNNTGVPYPNAGASYTPYTTTNYGGNYGSNYGRVYTPGTYPSGQGLVP